MSTRLVIVPQSFPFGTYSDFIRDEIEHLASRFDEVVVAPTAPSGELQLVPSNVTVDLGLHQRIATRQQRVRAGLCRPLAQRLALSELRQHSSPRSHVTAAAGLVAAAGIAAETQDWARQLIAGPPTIALSIWLGAPTLGLALAGLTTISRADRGDLFVDGQRFRYIPLQRHEIERCHAVYSVSDAGTADLRSRFPDLAGKISTRRLGTRDPGPLSPRSEDGILRVVSCSSLTPPKRPGLLSEVIAAMGRQARPVEWQHFGTGPLLEDFRSATASLPPSVRLDLLGHVPNEAVLAHYRSKPTDVLVNVSDSEGVPVSMMEAISVGVPIVGTDAGGVREIVNPSTGRLLPVDASADVVAEAVREIAIGFGRAQRVGVRRFWDRHYSAERNYKAFAEELACTLSTRTAAR